MTLEQRAAMILIGPEANPSDLKSRLTASSCVFMLS